MLPVDGSAKKLIVISSCLIKIGVSLAVMWHFYKGVWMGVNSMSEESGIGAGRFK